MIEVAVVGVLSSGTVLPAGVEVDDASCLHEQSIMGH
jgi:hypothetical protein